MTRRVSRRGAQGPPPSGPRVARRVKNAPTPGAALGVVVQRLGWEVRTLRQKLAQAAVVPPSIEPNDTPVRGLRAAAAVLNVGRNTLAMRIGALPEHQQPARLGARGVVWWPDADACREWWADLHTVEPPAPRARKRKSRVTTKDTRPLRERLADLG